MQVLKLRNSYQHGNIEKKDFIESMYKVHNELYGYYSLILSNDVDISNIDISNNGVVFTVASTGIKFQTSICDKRNAPLEIINFNNYENSESALMLKVCECLDNDFVFLDVGANIGWYSTLIAKKYSNASVFCFEPIAYIFTQLSKNIKLNKLDNCYAYNIGLSDKRGDLKVYFDESFSGKTSLSRIEDEGGVEVNVKIELLDDFINDNLTLSKVDIIKCDIEGAEIKFVNGGIKTLEKYKPVVFMELLRKWCAKFDYHPNDVINIFSSIGYKCFGIRSDKLNEIEFVDLETIETNYIFLHEEKHNTIINEMVFL